MFKHLFKPRSFIKPSSHPFLKYLYKCHSTEANKSKVSLAIEKLPRSLIRVSGKESSAFLQGLITNDMKFIENSKNTCLYAMFLNNKGAVIYDSIIYNVDVLNESKENAFLLECDANVVSELVKYLNFYKVRRKISVNNISDGYDVWCGFSSKNNVALKKYSEAKLDGTTEKLIAIRDPRFPFLGLRLITPRNISQNEIENRLGLQSLSSEPNYKTYRYKLGVGEGIEDLPPGKCFPLESNCDYLHGVSFHKGCYVGQELTARVYHTGVIRKRLMPVIFEQEISTPIGDNSKILSENYTRLGRLRAVSGVNGLGLLLVDQALNAEKLIFKDKVGRAEKPNWWPENE